MALRLISESVPKVADRAFKRKYIMLGRLVTHWSEIVGPELAGKAQPVKIRYYKRKKTGRSAESKSTASLDIAVSPADATVLHYHKDLILERINQIFGAGWITAIRFVPQESSHDNRRTTAPPFPKMPPKILTMQEKRDLSGMLETVQDPEIRERLQKLGTAILQDQKS